MNEIRNVEVYIRKETIETEMAMESARQSPTGAIVTFCGIVRDDGISAILVEAHEEVAQSDLENIASVAQEQYKLTSVHIEHRIGTLSIGETIVLIVCGAGHRKEAFQGCEYIIERLKERVPIWKKEYTKEGERWVPSEHE